MCRQRVPRAADAGHAQLEAAHIQHVEGDVVALAGLAQQVCSAGILQSCKHQRAGGRAANSQLVLLGAHGQARRVALDEKRGELLAVNLGEDRVQAAMPQLVIHCFSPLRM
jgi:hypothetical protein